MAVTIQMIETKEFKTKANGYDPEEVDVFLDEIADEFEEMQREIQSLRASVARPQPTQHAPSSVSLESTETLQKMLVNAQRVSDETMADARKQADQMLVDAKTRAERIVEEAKVESKRLQESFDSLRTAAHDYRARFKRLVDDQMHVLNGETELFR